MGSVRSAKSVACGGTDAWPPHPHPHRLDRARSRRVPSLGQLVNWELRVEEAPLWRGSLGQLVNWGQAAGSAGGYARPPKHWAARSPFTILVSLHPAHQFSLRGAGRRGPLQLRRRGSAIPWEDGRTLSQPAVARKEHTLAPS